MTYPTTRTSPKNIAFWSVWLGVMGLASVACVSETTGNEGNLSFFYNADDDVGNFNKPIAVGARLDLFVRDAGDGDRSVTLDDASVDDTSVASIVEVEGDKIVLEGIADGSFEVSVVATVAETGEEESDSVNMLVRVPEVLELRHSCRPTGDASAYYLVDQNIFVPFDMKLSDGQDVIGYGYYPVTTEPAGLATLDENHDGQAYIRYELGAQTGAVTVASTIDDTELTLDLVEPGAIDGISLDGSDTALRVGDTNFRAVRPTITGEEVCQANTTLDVTSATSDVCDVSVAGDGQAPEGVEFLNTLTLEIAAKEEGTCTFDVTYPEGADGQGVTESFSLPVEAQ